MRVFFDASVLIARVRCSAGQAESALVAGVGAGRELGRLSLRTRVVVGRRGE